MDSKKLPPGQKKPNSSKTDIIKRNIEKAKAPRVKSKENSKPVLDKPSKRTKSEKQLKPAKNPFKETKNNQLLQEKPKTKSSVKAQKKLKEAHQNKGKEVNIIEKTEDPAKDVEKDLSDQHQKSFQTEEPMKEPQIVEKNLEVVEKNEESSNHFIEQPLNQSSSKSLKSTPVREIQPKPLPSSYKRRRPSNDEDHFDEKCLKST